MLSILLIYITGPLPDLSLAKLRSYSPQRETNGTPYMPAWGESVRLWNRVRCRRLLPNSGQN